MGIRIEKNDITKVKDVDVIVNTANPYPVIGAGTDAAIYRAAGEEKLLNERLHKIGNIEPGEARISSGYDLCPYIIHTVGPKYIDGKHGEEQILRNCYRNSLKLARDNQCKHIAFPMISAGVYGYPKEQALEVAVSTIRAFLEENEMDVILVIFDRESFRFDVRLYSELSGYIRNIYDDGKGPGNFLGDVARSVAFGGVSGSRRSLFSRSKKPKSAECARAVSEEPVEDAEMDEASAIASIAGCQYIVVFRLPPVYECLHGDQAVQVIILIEDLGVP